MTSPVISGILSEIVASKWTEVERLHRSKDELATHAASMRNSHRPFAQALINRQTAIIAEIKKASPSKGVIQPNFDPVSIARTYEAGGAACLSVLTDSRYFQGSLDHLILAREATVLPVLRKDFTVDSVQIYEAAANGADAVLLIAAVLTVAQLREFRELADSLGLAALVEVHDDEELRRAVDSGAAIIGVNNRNLQTFEVRLDASLRLAEQMPDHVIRVSESGIFTRADIERLQAAGFHTFLVGESLMKAGDPAAALRALIGEETIG